MINRPIFKARLLRALGLIWPNGTGQNGSLGTTAVFTVAVVEALGNLFVEIGSPIRLDLETSGKFGPNSVRGLVVFNRTTQSTAIVPLMISPGLVRLNGRPVYLGHALAAAKLLDTIIDEIERVAAPEKKAVQKRF